MVGAEEVFAHRGFTFRWRSGGCIANAGALEALAARVGARGLPLPEMTYDAHHLEVARGALRLRFSAAGALASWHALQQSNSAVVAGSRLPVDVSSHDYTYTTAYDGELEGCAGGAPAPAAAAAAAIPLALISQRTPILAFASVPLFASDLNDRGTAEAGVKLRVMDDYFLVLCRAFTRIDRDRVRLRDVRYFCAFGGDGATSN